MNTGKGWVMQDLVETTLVPAFGKHKPVPIQFHAKVAGDENLERDGWWRTMSACMAVIKYLCNIAEEADKKIASLESRISALELLATSDELTGLLNRRGFFDAFAKEMDRTNRGHSEGGLMILVDLDNFKMINDKHGHQAGDAALRLVAKTLSADIRTMDSCARIGGDEFVLLLANTERTKALVRAQNMIKKLNALSLVWYGTEIPVRASLGLKDYKAGDEVEEIFDEADSRMYDVKRAGKRASIDIPQAV